MVGPFEILFNPGAKHRQEELASRELRREIDGTADPGQVRIDLESGVVVITSAHQATGQPDDQEPPPETDP